MNAHAVAAIAKANWPRGLLILAGLILLVGFVISPLLFVLVAVPLVIMVGLPTIIVLMVRKQQVDVPKR